MSKYVFGPVPSRRFGRSLGINNIPPKHCSYSCVYCQVGRTIYFEYMRKKYYDPEMLISEAIQVINKNIDKIDYVTFVPDGEPTLDINLGYEAESIKKATGAKLAIITNSSLIYDESVRCDLMLFDAVSLKVDTTNHDTWVRINRPHRRILFDKVLEGIVTFSKEYNGLLLTETMLVKGLNDKGDEIEAIATYLKDVNLGKAYLSIPIRPPTEPWVSPPDEEKITEAYNIFVEKLGQEHVELLITYEQGDFNLVGSPIESLLSTVSVHPMRIDYVMDFLKRNNIGPDVLDDLIKKGLLLKVKYKDYSFIVRRLPTRVGKG